MNPKPFCVLKNLIVPFDFATVFPHFLYTQEIYSRGVTILVMYQILYTFLRM